jgi:hypothetical protein
MKISRLPWCLDYGKNRSIQCTCETEASYRRPDNVIWEFALSEKRAVVTINGRDFYALASRTSIRHGVVVIPSGGVRDEMFSYIIAAVEWAGTRGIGPINFYQQFVTVDTELAITAAPIFDQPCCVAKFRELLGFISPNRFFRISLLRSEWFLCFWGRGRSGVLAMRLRRRVQRPPQSTFHTSCDLIVRQLVIVGFRHDGTTMKKLRLPSPPRRSIFCNTIGVTVEHVWPKWLRRSCQRQLKATTS